MKIKRSSAQKIINKFYHLHEQLKCTFESDSTSIWDKCGQSGYPIRADWPMKDYEISRRNLLTSPTFK